MADTMDDRPSACLDDRLSEAARGRIAAAGCRDSAGRRPRLPADSAVHVVRRAGRRGAPRDDFASSVRRRAEGTPVAYLVGHKEFYSLSFRVTPDVLIPRPETELLVVRLLDLAKQRGPDEQGISIADVGTGSGIIAVTVARKPFRVAESRRSTVSPAALAVARENAATHGVAERIEWFESDLFAAVPADRRFDFVASNPPYVSSAEFAKLPATVKNFEPRQALEAGPRGTEVIERLIPAAAERINPGGWLLMEISPMIEASVRELLEREPTLGACIDNQRLGRTAADSASEKEMMPG